LKGESKKIKAKGKGKK